MAPELGSPSAKGRPDGLRSALSRLLGGGEPAAFVRGDIRASWQRAAEGGLSPERFDVPFDGDVDVEAPLVRAARPVLDQLSHDLIGARMSVVLTDGRGQVVDRRVGDPRLLDTMDGARLAPGHLYTEGAVGTNGIGTALAGRRPFAVDGAEHFAEALTAMSCAGAPIAGPGGGALAGVIDLTCLAPESSALMLPLAMRAAQEIHQRLVDESGVAERFVLQRFLHERRGAKGPLVFITDSTMITNAAASHVVTPEDEPALRACADQIAGPGLGASLALVLGSGAAVTVRAERLLDGTRHVATMLRLTVGPDLGRGAAPSGATFGWESLTDTEHSVIDLVALGLTNREAAERLFVSPHTVGFHLRSIYRKLGVGSRVDLTRVVLERTVGPVAPAST
jgi:DNA-binding CsgD family transcriptional regulator